MTVPLEPHDALVVVDVQTDFVTGSLAVPDAPAVIPVINRYIAEFARRRLPVFATRDWHPAAHCSFRERGGPWPSHCVAGTPGSAFASGLALGREAKVVSKGTARERDAYSGFEGTDLALTLRTLHTRRLFVGGLATDYCVLHTVLDALRHGHAVFLLVDAIRAVDAKPGDGARARQKMIRAGAVPVRLADLELGEEVHG